VIIFLAKTLPFKIDSFIVEFLDIYKSLTWLQDHGSFAIIFED
jgi:hypothetical protein